MVRFGSTSIPYSNQEGCLDKQGEFDEGRGNSVAKIQFGPVYTRIHDVVTVREFGSSVETLGFDSLWVTESVGTPTPALDCMTTLAAFAESTTRVVLGPCVLLLPFWPPVLAAKAAATVDVLSGGRLVFGVGVGGGFPKAFDACGVAMKDRAARCDEALEIILKLWSGPVASHAGRFYALADFPTDPRPIQQPRPPIWIGGEADGALKRTARWADGWVPHSLTPARYAELLNRIGDHATGFGRDMKRITKAMHLYVHLGEDRETAQRDGNDGMNRRYGRSAWRGPEEGVLFGPPDDCVTTLQRYVTAGVEHFVLNFVCPATQVLGQIERFARSIVPRFRM